MPKQEMRACYGLLPFVVVALYFFALCVAQERSVRMFASEVPDMSAWQEAIAFGLSDRGARAWSRYSYSAKLYDQLEHELVAGGDKGALEFERMSLDQYVARHLQYRRTPEEDARMDPHLRELIAEQGR